MPGGTFQPTFSLSSQNAFQTSSRDHKKQYSSRIMISGFPYCLHFHTFRLYQFANPEFNIFSFFLTFQGLHRGCAWDWAPAHRRIDRCGGGSGRHCGGVWKVGANFGIKEKYKKKGRKKGGKWIIRLRSRFQVLDLQLQVLDFRFLILEFRFLVSGVWFQISSFSFQGSGL